MENKANMDGMMKDVYMKGSNGKDGMKGFHKMAMKKKPKEGSAKEEGLESKRFESNEDARHEGGF